MKKTLQIFAFAVIALAALASCAKEQFTENAIPAGEKIQVSINGQIGEFTSAEATKATAESVVRVTWESGEKVFVYDGSTACIGTLDVTRDEKNASYALLSGTISASTASPAPTKLTLVYVKGVESAPDIAEGKISIDLSAQNQKDVPFVLYSTIDYDAAKLAKSEEYISFSFATSVMTVNCTGLPTGAITKAEIDGVSTACELTVTGSGVTVAGASKGTITRTETAKPSVFTQSDSRGSFILALAADPAAPAARNILVYQDSKVYGAPFTSATLAGNKSYNTVYQLGEYVALEGFVDLGLPSGLKWGVCNLGASNPWEYGKYFQWGDITGRVCNGTTNGSTFEGGYYFQISNAPFHTGTSYPKGWTKYIPTGKNTYWSGEGSPDNKLVLDSEDDAASAANPDWRMPTKEDFQELYNNTECTWVNDYQGKGIAGRLFTGKNEGYTDKSVFFPAAGYPNGATLSSASSSGFYWSSSLYSSTPYYAYYLYFTSKNVDSQDYSGRFSGFSVRPVTTAAPKPAVKVEGVSLASKDTVEVGATKTLVATVAPANATHKEVTWSSSDEAVATVDENGEVTGVAAGSAIITATTTDGNFTAACIVTVKPVVPYVEIAAMYDGSNVTTLKWYRQNLAISASGQKAWKGKNTSAVKVPGTNDDVIVGDYFQWAAYAGYCGKAGDADKGLLIYSAFNNTYCVGDSGSNSFTFKSAGEGKTYQFHNSDEDNFVGISPNYSSSAYTKYTSGSLNLESSDDVASIILGDTWRMPTSAEFEAMKAATYWAWDATDKGYYVYAPQSDDAGKINDEKDSGHTYNKSDALLFFPAANGGNGTNFYDASDDGGFYWSSSLYSNSTDCAYNWYFYSNYLNPQNGVSRYYGFSVRPVSDK